MRRDLRSGIYIPCFWQKEQNSLEMAQNRSEMAHACNEMAHTTARIARNSSLEAKAKNLAILVSHRKSGRSGIIEVV